MSKSIEDILDFWYAEDTAKKWFKSTAEFDSEIKQHFESTWQSAADNKLSNWQNSPLGCLALCIVLDQFPLNMYRDQRKSYQTESQAINIAKVAISQGFDEEFIDEGIGSQKVSFLYMPLMHSENLIDQELCVSCFEKTGLKDNIRFAKHHHDLIVEFGRFPHRNQVLGRKSSNEEVAYLQSKRAFTG